MRLWTVRPHRPLMGVDEGANAEPCLRRVPFIHAESTMPNPLPFETDYIGAFLFHLGTMVGSHSPHLPWNRCASYLLARTGADQTLSDGAVGASDYLCLIEFRRTFSDLVLGAEWDGRAPLLKRLASAPEDEVSRSARMCHFVAYGGATDPGHGGAELRFTPFECLAGLRGPVKEFTGPVMSQQDFMWHVADRGARESRTSAWKPRVGIKSREFLGYLCYAQSLADDPTGERWPTTLALRVGINGLLVVVARSLADCAALGIGPRIQSSTSGRSERE
jgi:hypothetical protein